MRSTRIVTGLVACLAVALGTVAGPAGPASAAADTYFVSPGGEDSNAGSSTTSPFKTIQHCADVAQPGDTCRIMTGVYRETVTPPTSGTSGAPIVFVAHGDGPVSVDGADPITTTWTAVSSTDLAALQTGDPRLATAPIVDAVADGALFQSTVALGSDLSKAQIFVDGKMANIAQWPDSGADISHPLLGRAQSAGESGLAGWINDPNLTQPAGYWNGTKAWVNAWFVSQTQTVTSSSVGQIVMNSMGCKTISNTKCGALGYSHGHGTRYRLYGTLQAMSAPGQWLYSSADQKLYLWLEPGDTPAAHSIKAKARGTAFDLSGVSHITVRGLSIFASTIVTGPTTTGNVIEGVDAKYVSHYTDLASEPNLAYNTGYNVITAGELSSGIQIGGTGNVLRNSSIAFSAGNGVLVRGSGNEIVGNYIHETDYQGSYAAGINVVGTDQSVMYNTVFNSGRSALNIDDHVNGGNSQDNRIAYNDFHSVGALSTDLGLIYVCCDLDMGGTRIDHNWTHDDDPQSQTQGAIFFDCGAGAGTATRGALADRNVIWNMSGRSFVINGGSSISLVNNTATKTVLAQSYCGHTVNYAKVNELLTSQVAAAEFVDAASHDYRLATAATSIDAGSPSSPVTDGYFGAGPDKGAHEFDGAAWIAGCTWGPCWAEKTGYRGTTTVHEAEDAALTSVSSDVAHRGWSGSGYVPFGSTTGSEASFAISSSDSTVQEIQVRYSAPYSGSPGVSRTLSLYADGAKVSQLPFPSTSTATDWAVLEIASELVAGSDEITLRVDAADSGEINVDSVIVTQPNRAANKTIEAESYTAHNDTTVSNGGTGKYVGGVNSTSWLEYDNVDFGSMGLNSFQASIAVDPSAAGKQLEVRLDGLTGPVIGTMTATSTGGWTSFQTRTTAIVTTTGVHDVFLVPVGTGSSGYANVDWIEFGHLGDQRIEAEGFTAQNSTNLYTGGTGRFVGNISGNSWLEYDNVDFGVTGLNAFQASIAVDPSVAGKQIEIRIDSKTGTVIGTLVATSTGGWYTFATKSGATTLTTGVHDVFLVPVGSGSGYANIDWITFEYLAPQTTPVTQTIQAEAYDTHSGTNQYSGGTGTFVGNIQSGNWLAYEDLDFDAASVSSIQVSVAAASSAAGRQFAIRLDSVTGTVIGTLTVASTGGWYTFATQSTPIAATTGVHDVYLVPVGTGMTGYGNIDWFTFQ